MVAILNNFLNKVTNNEKYKPDEDFFTDEVLKSYDGQRRVKHRFQKNIDIIIMPYKKLFGGGDYSDIEEISGFCIILHRLYVRATITYDKERKRYVKLPYIFIYENDPVLPKELKAFFQKGSVLADYFGFHEFAL